MRYDKLGNALLHRLGAGATFSEVYLTATELGFYIKSKGPGTVVLEIKTGEDRYGNPITQTRWKRPEEVVEYLNGYMEDNDIIKMEEPEP